MDTLDTLDRVTRECTPFARYEALRRWCLAPSGLVHLTLNAPVDKTQMRARTLSIDALAWGDTPSANVLRNHIANITAPGPWRVVQD